MELWDLTTGKALWTEQTLQILGYEPNEFEPTLQNWKRLVHPDDWPGVSNNLNLHLEGKRKMFEAEYRARNKSGAWQWVQGRGKVIEVDADGKPSRMTGVFSDATEPKKAQEERRSLLNQLSEAQKMEAIGTLTGGIAHDFNNLLTVINGHAELLLMERTETDPIYSDLRKILDTGRKGAQLIQRLLAFIQKADINMTPVNLNDIVANSTAIMERTFPKIIEIETTLGQDVGLINADAVQVEQVIMNLCINAQDAMPNGGRLQIETTSAYVDENYCRLHTCTRPGRYAQIRITDSGSGMKEETMNRIFDPFFTTKGWDSNKGTGLGLSVAKGIAEQHGGWITCQSEPGCGTTFRLYFPVIEAMTGEGQSEVSNAAYAGNRKILLIDDEELVGDLGKRILERAGYSVLLASNGRDALDIYSREQQDIALIVLDLVMPHMGGADCLDRLLKINPGLKVIISSGHSLTQAERNSLSSHVKGFVDKPYQIGQFLEVVEQALLSR